jgi:hypothetical protein
VRLAAGRSFPGRRGRAPLDNYFEAEIAQAIPVVVEELANVPSIADAEGLTLADLFERGALMMRRQS